MVHRSSTWLLLGLAACAHRPAAPPAEIPPAAAVSTQFDPAELRPEPEATADAVAPTEGSRLCAPAPWTPPTDPDFSRVIAYADELRRFTGTPAIAAGIAVDGRVVWAKGTGLADVARRRRATADTPFSLASVSKPLTSTALMILVERGDVDLDAPINTYLGEPGVRDGAGPAAEVTVARVADHTSGLGLHYQFFYRGDGDGPPDYATTRRRHAIPVTPPGTHYQYSNLGYGLLEQVIAEVSDTDYATFMRTQLFVPLGMNDALVGEPKRSDGAAVRYGGDGKPVPWYGFDHDGASAAWASVEDLLKFGSFHAEAPLPGSAEVVTAPGRARMRAVMPASDHYGLGFGVRRSDGHPMLAHTGGMPGVRTILLVFPTRRTTVVVLTNGDGIGNGHRLLADAILDTVGWPWRSDALCGLAPDDPMLGRFVGTISTVDGTEPMKLTTTHDGDATIEIGEAGPARRLADVEIEADVLAAAIPLTAGPALQQLSLQRHGDRLHGALSTLRPGRSALTQYVDLRRVGGR